MHLLRPPLGDGDFFDLGQDLEFLSLEDHSVFGDLEISSPLFGDGGGVTWAIFLSVALLNKTTKPRLTDE